MHENIGGRKKNQIKGKGRIDSKIGEMIVDKTDIMKRRTEYTEEQVWDNRARKPRQTCIIIMEAQTY